MRTIRKGPEPPELAEYRLGPNPTYSGFRYMEALRRRLVVEQRGLCCYCMAPIKADDPLAVNIEHWRPRRFEELQLVYSNLLASCKGGAGQPRRLQHCDSHKRDAELSRNPADPSHNVESIVWFDTEGTIHSSNDVFDDELNTVLNLNAARLVDARKQALNAFRRTVPHQQRRWTKQELLRRLDRERDEGGTAPLRAYCQVIFRWLERQIASR